MNVAEQIAEICRLEGVRLVAGVMGGNATQLVRALDGIPGRHILYCRQERVAVDACDGYARITGEPGVVFTDAGPGAANTMVGIVNSWGDSVPVLFLPPVVGPYDNVFGRRHSKELPVAELFRPVSKWAMRLSDSAQIDDVMQRAFRLLREPRSGPVVIGPMVGDLTAASGSASSALSALQAVPAWPGAPRPVFADDLLPERALAGDDIARAVLVGDVYRPLLEAGSALLETVSVYLEQAASLEAAARILFVHPNTVRYRLRRVTDITGLAPAQARSAFTLQIALALGRLAEAGKAL